MSSHRLKNVPISEILKQKKSASENWWNAVASKFTWKREFQVPYGLLRKLGFSGIEARPSARRPPDAAVGWSAPCLKAPGWDQPGNSLEIRLPWVEWSVMLHCRNTWLSAVTNVHSQSFSETSPHLAFGFCNTGWIVLIRNVWEQKAFLFLSFIYLFILDNLPLHKTS